MQTLVAKIQLRTDFVASQASYSHEIILVRTKRSIIMIISCPSISDFERFSIEILTFFVFVKAQPDFVIKRLNARDTSMAIFWTDVYFLDGAIVVHFLNAVLVIIATENVQNAAKKSKICIDQAFLWLFNS